MNEVRLLYSCDAWHIHASMDLIGAFTSKKALKKFLNKMKKDGLINSYDLEELQKHRQTQGKTPNYHIDEEYSNPLYQRTKYRLVP
jgi:hypothetical protein